MDVENLLESASSGKAFLDSINLGREKSNGHDRTPDSKSSRDRDRPRDRDRERRRRSRSRDRSESGRSSHRRRSRSRSPYESRRRRDDRNDSRRDSRDHKRRRSRTRSRSPPPQRNRDSPKYDPMSIQPTRQKSPELSQEEHEMRSVFVQQLSARVSEKDLRQFFEAHGCPVYDSKIIVDRISRRSKGVGYVEFRALESMPKALSLSGQRLMGIPMIIQYTEAERNRVAMQQLPADTSKVTVPPGSDAHPNAPIPYNRLYVGSLDFKLSDADIRQVFAPFGKVDFVDLHRDSDTGRSKGYCFVQFRYHKDAVTALEKMNNFPIGGRPIKVSLISEKMQQQVNREAAAASHANMDDGDRGGNLSGISRIELMHKLSRQGEVPTSEVVTTMTWKTNVPTVATKNLLLSNMFNAAEETEPNWANELRDDVKQEVTDKYGAVADIYIVKDSQGEIYAKLNDEKSANEALEALNGRFFGGRRIQATFISDAIFTANRPSS